MLTYTVFAILLSFCLGIRQGVACVCHKKMTVWLSKNAILKNQSNLWKVRFQQFRWVVLNYHADKQPEIYNVKSWSCLKKPCKLFLNGSKTYVCEHIMSDFLCALPHQYLHKLKGLGMRLTSAFDALCA